MLFRSDHDKRFLVEVLLNGSPIGTGTGTSKKRAEQDAARVALEGFAAEAPILWSPDAKN